MTNVTVHIKNMAGEILPLVLPADDGVKEIAQRLTAMDRVTYPPYCTRVLRLEEKGDQESGESRPLQEDEMLAVFITSGFTTETGVFPEDTDRILRHYRGLPYTRFLFPLTEILPDYKGEDCLYVYPLHDPPMSGFHDTSHCFFHVSLSPCPVDEKYMWNHGRVLSRLVTMTSHITPEAMKYIQGTVDTYYEQLRMETGIRCFQAYDTKEVVVCECGAYVQRSGLPAHCKTKKHIKARGC